MYETAAEWEALAQRLLGSLSRFLGVHLEFVGNRRPDGDSFVPLVRSLGELLPAVGIRLAGMISCGTSRAGELKIEALLFLFAGGERVGPQRRQFFTLDYLGPGKGPEWVWRGWQTSDFPEQWDPYTFRGYFGGGEAELPGCRTEAKPPAPAGPPRK